MKICMMNIADGLENRDIAIRIRIQQDGDTVMQIRIQQDPVIRREENVKNAGMTGDWCSFSFVVDSAGSCFHCSFWFHDYSWNFTGAIYGGICSDIADICMYR